MLSFRKINPSSKNAALRTEVAYCGACVLVTFLMKPEKQWWSSLINSKGENGPRWRGAGYGPTLRLHHSSGRASLLPASSTFYDTKSKSSVIILWLSEAAGVWLSVVSRNHNASWGVFFVILGAQLRHLPTSPVPTGTRREVTMPGQSHKNLPHEICHHPSHPGAKGRGLEAPAECVPLNDHVDHSFLSKHTGTRWRWNTLPVWPNLGAGSYYMDPSLTYKSQIHSFIEHIIQIIPSYLLGTSQQSGTMNGMSPFFKWRNWGAERLSNLIKRHKW